MPVDAAKRALIPVKLLHVLAYTLYIWVWNIKLYFFPGEPKSLANEIILVTGGGNGIGREICVALAKEERNLAIISWDIDEAENRNTIEILKGLGVQRAHAYTVDVSDVEQVAAAAAKVRQDVGDVTMLFNNAGVFKPLKLSWNKEPSDVRKTFDVNVLSHIWTLREFFPNMVKHRRGHVIEMCSVAGFTSIPLMAEYHASKFAIRGYFECVKADLDLLKINDIHITFVYPSSVDTNMVRARRRDFRLNVPLLQDMSVLDVVPKIIKGVRQNKGHIYIPWFLHDVHLFSSILPDKIISKLKDVAGMGSLSEFLPDEEDRRALLQN